MTGWRLGFVHGPAEIIDTMIKLQQYTFVCAPQPVQWAGAVAMDVDMTQHVEDYRRKRDLIYAGLSDLYEVVQAAAARSTSSPKPPGAPAASSSPRRSSSNCSSFPATSSARRDTHFRISYAAPDETIYRGIDVLRDLA